MEQLVSPATGRRAAVRCGSDVNQDEVTQIPAVAVSIRELEHSRVSGPHHVSFQFLQKLVPIKAGLIDPAGSGVQVALAADGSVLQML
jgi:hypothetical protein